jgi:hypothetical protein
MTRFSRLTCSITLLVLAGCSGTSNPPPSTGEFAGTWSCGPGLPLIAITASGTGLTEVISAGTQAGSLSCTEMFSVSGSTATLIAGQTTCTGSAAMNVTGFPASETQTVSGDTINLTGADEGGPPSTVTCTRQ